MIKKVKIAKKLLDTDIKYRYLSDTDPVPDLPDTRLPGTLPL